MVSTREFAMLQEECIRLRARVAELESELNQADFVEELNVTLQEIADEDNED